MGSDSLRFEIDFEKQKKDSVLILFLTRIRRVQIRVGACLCKGGRSHGLTHEGVLRENRLELAANERFQHQRRGRDVFRDEVEVLEVLARLPVHRGERRLLSARQLEEAVFARHRLRALRRTVSTHDLLGFSFDFDSKKS